MNNSKRTRRRGALPGASGSLENPPVDARPEEIKKKTQTLEDIRDDSEASEEMKIRAILDSEVATGGKVYLQRRTLTDTDFARLGTIPVENFSIDAIMNTYGGGDYKGQVMSSTGRLVKGITFKIDHSIPPKHPLQRTDVKETDAVGLVKALKDQQQKHEAGGEMTTVLLAMMEAAERRAEAAEKRFEALLMRAAPSSSSGVHDKLLEKLLDLQLNQKQTPIKELLDSFQMIERLKKGEDLEDDKDDSPMGKLLDGLGTIIAPIVERVVQSQMGGGPPGSQAQLKPGQGRGSGRPDPAARCPGPAQTVDATTEDPNMMGEKMMLGQFKAMALKAAKERKDSWEWTLSVIGMVPEQYVPMVFAKANADDWFAQIFGADPEAQKYLEFLTEVRQSVLVIAFQTIAVQGIESKADPKAHAEAFVKWVNESFRPELAEITGDLEQFTEVFEQTAKETKPWLEQFRIAIANQLPADKPAAEAGSN